MSRDLTVFDVDGSFRWAVVYLCGENKQTILSIVIITVVHKVGRYIVSIPIFSRFQISLPQCVQQVFSLKLFRLVFKQPYATFNVYVGSLDKRTIWVHVIVQYDQADQYAKHEKVCFLFSELNGTVKHAYNFYNTLRL